MLTCHAIFLVLGHELEVGRGSNDKVLLPGDVHGLLAGSRSTRASPAAALVETLQLTVTVCASGDAVLGVTSNSKMLASLGWTTVTLKGIEVCLPSLFCASTMY